MRKFLFFTTEGWEYAPDGDPIQNCQMLGRAEGENIREAKENLLLNYPWITERGYHDYCIECVEITG